MVCIAVVFEIENKIEKIENGKNGSRPMRSPAAHLHFNRLAHVPCIHFFYLFIHMVIVCINVTLGMMSAPRNSSVPTMWVLIVWIILSKRSPCLFQLFRASGHQKLMRTVKHSDFQSASIKFVWVKTIQHQHKHIIG